MKFEFDGIDNNPYHHHSFFLQHTGIELRCFENGSRDLSSKHAQVCESIEFIMYSIEHFIEFRNLNTWLLCMILERDIVFIVAGYYALFLPATFRYPVLLLVPALSLFFVATFKVGICINYEKNLRKPAVYRYK